MSDELPPGVTIALAPPELRLGRDHESPYSYRRSWYGPDDDETAREPSRVQEATGFPEPLETVRPGVLQDKLFACSGSVDSFHYQEATRFRAIPQMTWEEARVALKRLLSDADRRWAGSRSFVDVAEFTLTAWGFEGFVGRKGDHAVKLRKELSDAVLLCIGRQVQSVLHTADAAAATIARPITERLHKEDMWRGNGALWAIVPASNREWVRIIEAGSDQIAGALDFLRAQWETSHSGYGQATDVSHRLVARDRMPTAAEYAEALHTADMLAFIGEKLTTLYAAIMHSMPVYRLHPATSEREAIELWWPWGRPPPLVDGGPARPSKARKKVLDPRIITATRPQDVVREVMQRTGINRTTAQHLTALLRIGMRLARQRKAEALLRQGVAKAVVARSVGLSPSRISAMFKGQTFPTKTALPNSDGIESDLCDENEDNHV
jgi:hypothetical protein